MPFPSLRPIVVLSNLVIGALVLGVLAIGFFGVLSLAAEAHAAPSTGYTVTTTRTTTGTLTAPDNWRGAPGGPAGPAKAQATP